MSHRVPRARERMSGLMFPTDTSKSTQFTAALFVTPHSSIRRSVPLWSSDLYSFQSCFSDCSAGDTFAGFSASIHYVVWAPIDSALSKVRCSRFWRRPYDKVFKISFRFVDVYVILMNTFRVTDH